MLLTCNEECYANEFMNMQLQNQNLVKVRVHTETVKQNSRTFQGHFVFFKDSFFIDSYSPNTVFLISPVVLQASGPVLSKILFFFLCSPPE